MSLWVMAGVQAVKNTTQVRDSSTQVYIDDRTVTASSAPDLFRLYTTWQSWSQSVGLVERVSKTRVAAARSSNAEVAGRFFDPGVVQPAVRVLGAVSACVRRALHADELRRLADAKRVIHLLGCCRFLLGNHLRCVRQFAIAKACYGWLARAPSWSVSHSPFTATFVAARRVRYSSPWLRALFLGGNLHLDVVWVTRLVAAVLRFRLRSGVLPSWEGGLGSCAACLRRWMSQKGFTILQPWIWWHEFAHVRVDLSSRRLSGLNVDCHIGLAQHNVRQGWRAWVFQHWLGSGRHELLRLSVLVTGLSCPMLVISLLPVFGVAGKLGSGITSAGPAPVVLPHLLVVLVVLCWLALVGLVRTPIFLRKKLMESEVGYLHAN